MQINQLKSIKATQVWFILLILAKLPSLAIAQTALKKGDKMPDVIIENIYNDHQKELNVAKMHGKIIIFDFWSPTCVSCLKSFPKMDSLQRTFANEIVIILVNKESLDSTKRFFDKRKFLFRPNIPFATNDKTLNKLFPNLGNPAYAWINAAGEFQRMSNEITKESIHDFIAGNNMQLDEFHIKNKYLNSLFDREYESTLVCYSYLSKSISGVKLNGSIGKNGLSFDHCGLMELYKEAFGEKGKYNFSGKWKIELKMKDVSRFVAPADTDSAYHWRKDNLYNYAVLMPEGMAEQKFKIMQTDLKRYLGFDAKIEKRLINSMILVKVGNTDKLKSRKTGVSNFSMSGIQTTEVSDVRRLINRPFKTFSDIFGAWVALKLEKPFIDETGYTENIDIELKGSDVDNFDISKIRTQLREYGLGLIEEERPIDVLVISEKVGMKE